MNSIKQLRQYYSPQAKQIFQQAQHLPQFFSDNLVDPNRIVKSFINDPQANLRIFYYQYLKLCFQIDNVDYESYIDKIYELIRSDQFFFTFPESQTNKEVKNVQFKTLMIDFFDIMNSGSLSIDLALNQYPILDQVFTNFFRTITMLAGVAESYDSYIQKRSLYQFLTSYFSVDISSYDKCLKFVQSDIFVYQQDVEHIYMAFIKDDQTVNESYQQNSSINNQNISSYYSESNSNINEGNFQIVSENKFASSQNKISQNLNVKTKTIIKQSYIQSQFADFTQYKSNNQFNSNNLDRLVNNLKSSTSFQQEDQLFKNNLLQRKTQIEDHSQQTQQNTKEMFFAHQNQDKQIKRSSSGLIKKDVISKQMSMPNFHTKQSQFNIQLPTKDPGFQINLIKVSQTSVTAKNKSIDTPIVAKSIQNQFSEPYSRFTKDSNASKAIGNSNSVNLYNQNSYNYNYKTNNLNNGIGSYANNSISNGNYNNFTGYENLKMNQSKKLQQKKPYYQAPSYEKEISTTSLSYKPLIQVVGPTKKDRYGLNVTKQFTNSIVMKIMKEPFKSSTYQIREKARNYRRSLYSYTQ